MGIWKQTKARFSAYLRDQFPTYATESNKTVAAQRIVNRSVNYLIGLSNFENMKEEEIYEQLWTWEPEVGGAADRMSSLVRKAFKGFFISDLDIPKENEHKELLKYAKQISEGIKWLDIVEMYADLLVTQGNVFIDIRPPRNDIMHNPDVYVHGKPITLTYKILPNKMVTLVDRHTQVANNDLQLITEGNILVLKEMMSDQQVLGPGEFIHLKYKNTPVFTRDFRGRVTFGVYSVSPIHRTIIPVWMNRQTSIIDLLHRWKILPREVHSIDATMFDLNQYAGTPEQKMAAAQEAAASFLSAYNQGLESQGPDEGYVVLNSAEITILESKSSQYMRTNELIDQRDRKIWTALNIPESVVNGTSKGSYASELVTSNYVSSKAEQLAEKIKPVILKQIRDRISLIDKSLPVSELDIRIKLDMAANQLEDFRSAAIMATLNCFTRTEIRARLGYGPLDEADEKNIINVKGGLGDTVNDVNASTGAGGVKGDASPDTPQSSQDHITDAGSSAAQQRSEAP